MVIIVSIKVSIKAGAGQGRVGWIKTSNKTSTMVCIKLSIKVFIIVSIKVSIMGSIKVIIMVSI